MLFGIGFRAFRDRFSTHFQLILSSGSWPGSHSGGKTQKGAKKSAKLRKNGGSEAPLGASGGPKSRPKGVRTAKSCLGQGRRRGQESHLEVFWATLWQKSIFLEMYEKPKEKHGLSRVREGPGTQVGGTWAPKSCPRGVRTAKMTSNRAAGGVRTFIFMSFGRLYSKSCYFLKCMKNLRKSMVFQGLERV